MGWAWKTGTARERAHMVRAHWPRTPPDVLRDVFALTPDGLDAVLAGNDWRQEYSTEESMSRIAEASQAGRYLPDCTGACLSRTCNCVPGHAPYGGSPGFKEPTTSKAAAKAVSGGVASVREAVFQAIATSEGGLTADEAAAIVGRKAAYVRPRVSELAKARPPRIVPTGKTRKNPESGLAAKVWRKA